MLQAIKRSIFHKVAAKAYWTKLLIGMRRLEVLKRPKRQLKRSLEYHRNILYFSEIRKSVKDSCFMDHLVAAKHIWLPP